MSRANQIERHIERQEAALSRDLADGRISNAEYNREMRELQAEAREAYQQDVEDAQERVRDEWGW